MTGHAILHAQAQMLVAEGLLPRLGGRVARFFGTAWICSSFLCASFNMAFAIDVARPQLSGTVNDPGKALFEYSSDANDGPMPSINNRICNNDEEGLIFSWEKARLTRGIFNPLPPSSCQENPHNVAGVREEPDYDAQILYTQAGLSRTAAVYAEKTSSTKETHSSFKTTYFVTENEQQEVNVEISYTVSSPGSLDLAVYASPPGITIGLGKTQWLFDDKFSANGFSKFAQDADDKGVITDLNYAQKIIANEDLMWLPDSLKQNSILQFTGDNLSKPVILQIPLKPGLTEALQAKLQTLYLFDKNHQLIATGSYTQLSPE